jgi:hypothetical protein
LLAGAQEISCYGSGCRPSANKNEIRWDFQIGLPPPRIGLIAARVSVPWWHQRWGN